MAQLFTEQHIPFATISTRQIPGASADANQAGDIDGLHSVSEFLHHLLVTLITVRGDEIDDYQPELLALQEMSRHDLLSLDNDDDDI